jgi:hypothetical protein
MFSFEKVLKFSAFRLFTKGFHSTTKQNAENNYPFKNHIIQPTIPSSYSLYYSEDRHFITFKLIAYANRKHTF